MLFSNREVAEFIHATFEPVWQSVRPVPIVTIDFGTGTTVTRTLHGNIASYVCDADGRVIDLLPGIYTPKPYREQLAAIAGFAKSVRLGSPDGRAAFLEYHRLKALALAKPVGREAEQVARTGGGFKGGSLAGEGGGFGGFGGDGGSRTPFVGPQPGGIEGSLEQLLVGPADPAARLADLPEMRFDAFVNETVRRRQVHDKFLETGPVTPDQIRNWLYREVLKADLEDPLLGLGPVLNAGYPFGDEDRKAGGR